MYVYIFPQVRFQAKNYSAQSIEAMREFDDVLVQLVVCLSILETTELVSAAHPL